MGVPARFSLWILTDLERALNVFSFQVSHSRFNLLYITGIPQHPKALQIVCNTSHTIASLKRQTSVSGFFSGPSGRTAPHEHLVQVGSGVTIKGLVELSEPPFSAAERHSFITISRFLQSH